MVVWIDLFVWYTTSPEPFLIRLSDCWTVKLLHTFKSVLTVLCLLLQTKEEIAHDVKEELTKSMSDFGFMIIQTLVTDIEPDMKVRAAMNEINAAQRLRYGALQPSFDMAQAYVYFPAGSMYRASSEHIKLTEEHLSCMLTCLQLSVCRFDLRQCAH